MSLYTLPDKKYKPEYAEKAVELMGQGYLDYELAAHFKVSVNTISNWKKEHPEFKEAWEIGDPMCFSWWLGEGKTRYMDSDKGMKFWSSIMRHRFGWGNEDDKKVSTTNNLTIGSINVLNGLSEKELLEVFQEKQLALQKFIPAIGQVIEHGSDEQE